MSELVNLSKVSFSGHETFPFRYAWLKKGYDDVLDNPRALTDQDEAMTRLGVGKNMVRSIRHWCLATQILKEAPIGADRGLYRTPFGDSLLHTESGFDPFLEDTGSLWLLHWQLCSNVQKATTWYTVFSDWVDTDFTKEQLTAFLEERLEQNNISTIASSSVKRDVDCFVRTYAASRTTNTLLLEDTLDCPLIELNLLSQLSDGRTYQIHYGDHPTLPDLVFAYILADYWEKAKLEVPTFEALAYWEGSPGRLLRLNENALLDRLERLHLYTRDAFAFRSTAGIRQVYRGSRTVGSPLEFLREYYQEPGRTGR